MSLKSRFHLAYNIRDLEEARHFYGEVLGCQEGRSTETWVDFDFFGHQISLHLGQPFVTLNTGHVGEHKVPMPHLGVILPLEDWKTLAAHLEGAVQWEIPPQIRFEGEPGEQRIMFFRDPSGNAIEIKGFADFDGIFAS